MIGGISDRNGSSRAACGTGSRGAVRRVLRGKPRDPAWARPALLGLLALTAAGYLAGLGRNGWANDFYAAAVQAGTKSWKAFSSARSTRRISSRWTRRRLSCGRLEISGRIRGLDSWSLLVPQALEGVASADVLYAAVRRWSGPAAGIISGLVLAVTPAAALMFRFGNPDAMLTLLLTAAAYAVVRAIEAGRTRWLVFAGVLLGFGFLSKMLQAFAGAAGGPEGVAAVSAGRPASPGCSHRSSAARSAGYSRRLSFPSRAAVGDPACRPHRPDPGRGAAVGRLAAGAGVRHRADGADRV